MDKLIIEIKYSLFNNNKIGLLFDFNKDNNKLLKIQYNCFDPNFYFLNMDKLDFSISEIETTKELLKDQIFFDKVLNVKFKKGFQYKKIKFNCIDKYILID